MVSGECGERKILSSRVVLTIQSIKEVVKDHSDADIYVALQEMNMDPNETIHKLLSQDPFHEVMRKRDKKDVRLSQNTGYRVSTEARKPIERVRKSMKSNPSDLGVPRGGNGRNTVAVGSREFRVVKDNRVNKNVSREVKPPSPQSSTSISEQRSLQVSEKSSTVVNQKSSGGNHLPRQASVLQPVSHTVIPQVQVPKPNDSKLLSAVLPSSHSVVGVYSSSSDPVHVPSPESRSAAKGAIKRDLGAVGVRRQTSGNSAIPSTVQRSTISNSNFGKDGISSRESSKSSSAISTTVQPSQTSQPESVFPSVSGSRPSSSNQYNSRSHQQVAGHQKASQPAKEWKRKSSPKSNTSEHGVIGSPSKTVSHPADSSQHLEIDVSHMQDKISQVDVCKNQNVFIAEHIRVSDSDRSRLTFGSFFATDINSSGTTASESLTVRAGENPSAGVSISLASSIPGLPSVETSASKHVDVLDDQVQDSASNSPAPGGLSDSVLPDKKRITNLQTVDNYADIGLVHDDSPSFTRTDSQQQQDPSELASFSVYDPQASYGIPYFRPSIDELVRSQGLPSPQEALGSHMTNNIPVSSIHMVQQQQQPPMPQMYQQLHVSPFANLMPYRQFISPLYGPPIPMTGYSGNPSYPQPSNGNSFLLMPGGSSHLGANNLKYGIQQFKPVPAGTPTGFGNFASPAGYAINPPGVVGGATGLEESSRLKYKDGNLYVPNPHAETSEMWIQNPREISNMQSASYYNMAGQAPPHGAYMPPHAGHVSFNAAAVAQSSHMQFPQGLYQAPPPQPVGMANPQHLGGGGVNVVAGAAPGAQVGAYQQPQMSHLNWNANF